MTITAIVSSPVLCVDKESVCVCDDDDCTDSGYDVCAMKQFASAAARPPLYVMFSKARPIPARSFSRWFPATGTATQPKDE